MKFQWVAALAVVTMMAAFAVPSYAVTLDLTSAGSSGTINGAQFFQTEPNPTGTGVINAFVRLSNNTGTVSGYNTTVDNVFDNTTDDPHNHAILLADVPTATLADNIEYYQFALDINENRPEGLISLDEVQVFQSSIANQSVTTFTGDIVDIVGDLVYRMDPTNSVLLDWNTNSGGSGQGDMFMYIPVSAFAFAGEYVYLYSEFGMDIVGAQEDAGFEEWYIQGGTPDPIPEPTSMVLLGIGIAGMAARRRFQA